MLRKLTADIDNAVDALLLSASEEQAIFESELSDASYWSWITRLLVILAKHMMKTYPKIIAALGFVILRDQFFLR